MLTEHRDDLVRSRTQIVNRLHALLAQLIPAGLSRGLTADSAAAALRSIRPRAVLARTMRQVAVELLGELRRLDRRIAEATATLSAAVAASGTTLTDLLRIGDVTAAKILARSGAVNRFRSESAFASYCGVAPLEVSSGDIQRHRLSRAGDRQGKSRVGPSAVGVFGDRVGEDTRRQPRGGGCRRKEGVDIP
ncbi:transposase [Micromonospora sp. NPDC023633]|uniref:transposase n=1 Tax=Micromonospora sp. NPDC023633 TaxID=3154320 RepID=UPI0033D49322